MSAVFYDNEIKSGLLQKRKLSAFLVSLVHEHRPETKMVQLRYVFCSDEYLHKMNVAYLNHDTLTDIITFDLSSVPEQLDGELYISIDRVKENAEKYGVPYLDELYRVIFHGALHLCGYGDKTEADATEMRRLEGACIAGYKEALTK